MINILFNQIAQKASEDLELMLFEEFPSCRRSVLEDSIKHSSIERIWEVTLPKSRQEVYILKLSDYPLTTIILCTKDITLWNKIPHIGDGGFLCVDRSDVQHYPPNHLAITREQLNRADQLLLATDRQQEEEWQNEIYAYWGNQPPQIISLLKPHSTTRTILYYHHDNIIYVADTEVQLRRWLKNHYGMLNAKISTGAVIQLSSLPSHAAYPQTFEDIKRLAKNHSLLQRLSFKKNRATPIIFAHGTAHEIILLGTAVQRVESKVDRVRDKVDHALMHISKRPPQLTRCRVIRADDQWIHFRGGRTNPPTRKKPRIAILGCGSLGSGVAEQLARSGIQSLYLVDPEDLSYDNIARHILGASFVGMNKALALKKKLEADFPHQTHYAYPYKWSHQKVLHWLNDMDLVIATMAIWQENVLLNHLAYQSSLRPIIYGWLEPHAIAAHGVYLHDSSACLQCGFQLDGKPRLRASLWPQQTHINEPGCGGSFQPYGSIDMLPAHAMLAEMALDRLNHNFTHTVRHSWLGKTTRLIELGGRWNTEWELAYGAVDAGQKMIITPWVNNPVCSICGSA